ncbi:thioredoxin domain-containing protein [Amycolatopsis sp. 195334CR]|uniref:DsbA family protein n=1 Tax=Amycolatopsis sp. 195334CR TaxID=2814588 RepID=UPI001A8E80E3|nr:thioredoxin domain-containing protein [Amycolatopsis sp. 195334CR]MBN6034216.1 thioredoxin domain-containing protein [Amycolatopsis sp. 195334CR]
MGGAERTARKKRQEQQRQQAAKPTPAPARGVDKRMVGVVVAVVVVTAAVVGGIVWYQADKNQTEGQTIAAVAKGAPAWAEQRDGLVVVSGSPSAKATLDVYADFLCPACGEFQKRFGKQIEEQVAAGNLVLRTHMVPMLSAQSDPEGYSLDSANAGLCAADAGVFTPFHDSLFAAQPEEGKRGWDKGQLTALGQAVGVADPAFPACVEGGTYNQQLDAELKRVTEDPALHQEFPNGSKGFGTPTVMAGGKPVNTADAEWLTKLVSAG